MISTKLKKNNFKILFPYATAIISKKKAGTYHYVIFDKRPNKLSLEVVLNIKDSIIIVSPSNFSTQSLEKSLYWILFLDIVFSGNLEYDSNDNFESIKLYLFIHYKKNTEKSPNKTISEIQEIINYTSAFNAVISEQLRLSLINITQKYYIPKFKFRNYYSGDINMLGFIPDQIKLLLNRKSISKRDYLNILSAIVKANIPIDAPNELIFFYIQNVGVSYIEIMSTLLNCHNSDLFFLIEECKFLSWLDIPSNKIVFKLEEVKKYKKEILKALQNINECLKTYFSKSLIAPSNEELINLKIMYRTERSFLNIIDLDVFIYFLKFLQNEEYSEYNLINFYISIIKSLTLNNNNISEEGFLNYIYINWITDIKIRDYQTKNYRSYSRVINSYSKKLKTKQKFLSVFNSTRKEKKYFPVLSDISGKNIIKQYNANNYSLHFNKSLGFNNNILEDKEKIPYAILKNILDKIANCAGINNELKVLSAYFLICKE